MKSAIKRLLCSRSGTGEKNGQSGGAGGSGGYSLASHRREPEGRPDEKESECGECGSRLSGVGGGGGGGTVGSGGSLQTNRLEDDDDEKEYGMYTPLRSELQKVLRNSAAVGHHLKYQHKVR